MKIIFRQFIKDWGNENQIIIKIYWTRLVWCLTKMASFFMDSTGISYSVPNQIKFWAFWQKGVNYFWQTVNAILEHFSVAKTNVQC